MDVEEIKRRNEKIKNREPLEDWLDDARRSIIEKTRQGENCNKLIHQYYQALDSLYEAREKLQRLNPTIRKIQSAAHNNNYLRGDRGDV